jgi:gliding motility-associated-like protein
MHCNNEQVTFIDTLYGRKADQWIWDVFNTCDTSDLEGMTPVQHTVQDTTMDKPYLFNYTFGQAGCYTVRLIKYKPNDCVEYDTSYTQVTIGSNPAILNIVAQKLPPCNSFKYKFENYSTNAKDVPFSDSAFVWDFGDGSPLLSTKKDTTIIHQYPGEGSYTVTLRLQDTASFCNAPLDSSIVISISNELKAIIQAPDTVCIPSPYLLGNASQGGTNFKWIITTPGGTEQTFLKGDLSQLSYDFDQPGRYLIRLIAEDTICQDQDEAIDTVFAYPAPSAAFTFDENHATNKVITFTNNSVSNFPEDPDLHYLWSFGDGVTSTEKNPQHLFPQTGTYRVLLTVYNNGGCMDTASVEITETIIPKLAVPDAFTPNGDGLNDHIAPIAFGVTKIEFRIYNRWGQMVFQSNDPQITYLMNKGWDGTFKGKPQEMDTYAYTLQAVFNDGTETTKQGSITLIR